MGYNDYYGRPKSIITRNDNLARNLGLHISYSNKQYTVLSYDCLTKFCTGTPEEINAFLWEKSNITKAITKNLKGY